jgi:hypothetical protein
MGETARPRVCPTHSVIVTAFYLFYLIVFLAITKAIAFGGSSTASLVSSRFV